MTLTKPCGMLTRVKSPKNPTAILLENAIDLLFEIYLLRGDCSAAAKALVHRGRGDAAALEQCAKLDDTLAQAYRSLQATLRKIQAARGEYKLK